MKYFNTEELIRIIRYSDLVVFKEIMCEERDYVTFKCVFKNGEKYYQVFFDIDKHDDILTFMSPDGEWCKEVYARNKTIVEWVEKESI